jgi:hypothetical protein
MSRLETAAATIPALRGYCHRGLQALRGADAGYVSAAKPRTITHSLDLDRALARTEPNATRWDYGIGKHGNLRTEELVWVEIHPASSSGNLGEVKAKASWLQLWLVSDGVPLNYRPRRFVWVASGRSAFSRNDPKVRALQNLGIEFTGGHLML